MATERAQTWLGRLFVLKFLALRGLTIVLDVWELCFSERRGPTLLALVSASNFLVLVNSATDCPLLLLGREPLRARLRKTVSRACPTDDDYRIPEAQAMLPSETLDQQRRETDRSEPDEDQSVISVKATAV